MRVHFSDRSWTSCGRGSKLWKKEVKLHKLSSPLSLPHRQSTMRTLALEQVLKREKRGTREVKRKRGKEMKNWVQMQRRKKERKQHWSSRQTGGSTGIGYVTHHNYVKEFIDVWEKHYIKKISRHFVLDLSFYLHLSAFYLKDTVMLQSALRGHLLRESRLKDLLKDAQNKVSPTHKHSDTRIL